MPYVVTLPNRTAKAEVKSKTEVHETVTVTPRRSESRSFLLKPEGSWGWEEIRDYVVNEIESRHGAFPRDARKEASIFQRFCKKYGTEAETIARVAFEVNDGYWKGAPISVNRFCKASDPYFGDVILAAIAE